MSYYEQADFKRLVKESVREVLNERLNLIQPTIALTSLLDKLESRQNIEVKSNGMKFNLTLIDVDTYKLEITKI